MSGRRTNVRVETLRDAMEHRFDHDDNAPLRVDTADPVLQAAVEAVNRWGGWREVMLAPTTDFIELLEMVESRMSGRIVRPSEVELAADSFAQRFRRSFGYLARRSGR